MMGSVTNKDQIQKKLTFLLSYISMVFFSSDQCSVILEMFITNLYKIVPNSSYFYYNKNYDQKTNRSKEGNRPTSSNPGMPCKASCKFKCEICDLC